MARNLRLFGAVWSDPSLYRRIGRPEELSAEHEDGLISFLLENKHAYQFEMTRFLEEEFDIFVSRRVISDYLRRLRCTCKKISRESAA